METSKNVSLLKTVVNYSLFLLKLKEKQQPHDTTATQALQNDQY